MQHLPPNQRRATATLRTRASSNHAPRHAHTRNSSRPSYLHALAKHYTRNRHLIINIHSSISPHLAYLGDLSPSIIERISAGALLDISVNKMIPITTPLWAEQGRAHGVV